jgi:chromosome partitioning protein
MPNVIAVCNQKGGVGKTTSVLSLAAEFARAGNRTLIVDLDPQGNATSGIKGTFIENGPDLYDVFLGTVSLSSLVQDLKQPFLHIVPASKDLMGIETELGKKPGRELILNSEFELLKNRYDYIFIDCPPSSGILSLNALGAADYVLIPLQAEYFALEGISALLTTLNFVRETFNPNLSILGVFLTMFDSRTNLANQIETENKQFFGELAFETRIPRSVRLSECPSHGVPICEYDPSSVGAKAYHTLAQEVLEKLSSGQQKMASNL